MRIQKTLQQAVFGSAFLLTFTAAAQNFIVNGDFESPILGVPSQASPFIDEWIGAAFLFNGNGGISVFPLPQSGNQYADIGNRSGFHFSTLFVAPSNGDYQLSWFDNTASGFPGFAAPYNVNVSDGNSSLAMGSYDANHDGIWRQRSLPVTLTGGTFYGINFYPQGQDLSGLDVLIDNVALVATAVPEPSAYVAVGGLVLLGFGIWRRIRR